MERMTLIAFRRYCDAKQFQDIILCYDNQDAGMVNPFMKFDLVFHNIMVSADPTVGGIFLSEGGNLVYFQPVQYVLVDENRTPLGTVVDVVCGNRNESNKIPYRLIMR